MSTIAIDPSGGPSSRLQGYGPGLDPFGKRADLATFELVTAMGQRTIYERAACGAVSMVVTPSLVKKLR